MPSRASLPDHPPQDLATWFPDVRPAPPAGTFELGLVLAGAVSAGAYTAGALDFLYEALDTWYRAKAVGEADVPRHDVVLRLITGASAGGMNGAISAAALRYGFAHPQAPGKAPDAGDFRRENPFWRAWVEEIDIRPLLDTSDLGGGLRSLLNCGRLVDIVQGVIDRPGRPLGTPAMRGWLENPLTVMLTVTNLRGVPYQVVFSGECRLRHEMSLHRDFMAFAVPGLSGRPPVSPVPPPDLVALPEAASFEDPVWRAFGMSALASGAFPVFLEARKLSRPAGHYLYRNLMRDGDKATRAVVMIDPFADPGEPGPATEAPLTGVAAATFRSLINQARFTFRDRMLIQDENVYSRFMIAPRRSDIAGARSLASGGLGASSASSRKPTGRTTSCSAGATASASSRRSSRCPRPTRCSGTGRRPRGAASATRAARAICRSSRWSAGARRRSGRPCGPPAGSAATTT